MGETLYVSPYKGENKIGGEMKEVIRTGKID